MRFQINAYYRTVKKYMVSSSDFLSIHGTKVYRKTQQVLQKIDTRRRNRSSVTLPERRIILIGKSGSGKSATGNNILKQDVFPSGVSASSLTRRSVRGTAQRFNRNIQIIDTPGLFDTNMPQEDVKMELLRCLGMVVPGPHAFVLVIPVHRFTEEDRLIDQLFKGLYGEGMMKHSIVLFTKKDSLGKGSVKNLKRKLNLFRRNQPIGVNTLEEYVQKAPQPLVNLLRDCGNRYVSINNKGNFVERRRDVKKLVKMVEEVVKENGNTYYTSPFLQSVENETKKEEKKRRSRLRKQISDSRMREKVRENLNKDSALLMKYLLQFGKEIVPLFGFVLNVYRIWKDI